MYLVLNILWLQQLHTKGKSCFSQGLRVKIVFLNLKLFGISGVPRTKFRWSMPAWLKTGTPCLNKNITGQKLSNANQRFQAVKLHCRVLVDEVGGLRRGNLEVFVGWILISVDLHGSNMSLLRRSCVHLDKSVLGLSNLGHKLLVGVPGGTTTS